MPRNDDTQFDAGQIGTDTPGYVRSRANLDPWRLNETRIDGIPGPIPAFQAGKSITLHCVFLPTEGAADHVQRWQSVRKFDRYAGTVHTYQTQGRAYYRESHREADSRQLALLEPLAETSTGYDPTRRESVYEAMWVVVTNVEPASVQPETVAELDVEATIIARKAEHETRQAVRSAFERNGFGL